jgi:hypothetical protein
VAARVGLDPDFYDTYAFGRKNTTYRIRRPWLHLTRRAVGRRLSPATRRRLKAATAGAYARINVEPVRDGQAGDETDVLRDLDRAFAPYDERLAELTGLDLSAWR